MMTNTNRETVKVNGQWVKSVSWAPGAGLKVKRVFLTRVEREAATFLPSTAVIIRRAYGPEAAARVQAAEEAVTRILAEAFTESLKHINPKYAADAAAIMKGIL